MIFTLSIIINLCLIFVGYDLLRRQRRQGAKMYKYSLDALRTWGHVGNECHKKYMGALDKVKIKTAIAEKLADRAFNLASTANLGVVAIQKTLVTRPRFLSKEQMTKNELAKKDVDTLFGKSSSFDWLRPILSDEEQDLLDQVEAHAQKRNEVNQ
jgi:hypothetical protein